MRYVLSLIIAVLLMASSLEVDAGLVEDLRSGKSNVRASLEGSSSEDAYYQKYMREAKSAPDFKVFVTWNQWIHYWQGAPSAEQAIEDMLQQCKEKIRKCRIYAVGNTIVLNYSQEELADAIEAYQLEVSGSKTPKDEVLSRSYDAVGSFDDYAGVYQGQVNVTSDGKGNIFLSEINGSNVCRGVTWITDYSVVGEAVGQKGKGTIECDDGRLVEVEWIQESEEGGVGSGKDKFKNTLSFKYDLNTLKLKEFKKRLVAQSSSKKEIPPVYRPKETRADRGFNTGTAFFVSSKGHAVTNFHVIEDATDILVKLVNSEIYKAVVLVSDPVNDIALIKINSETQPLPITSRIRTRKGEQIVVLGYPLIALQGQEQKATFGRINSLTGIRDDIRFFQFDAPVQPGNSGGLC